MGYCPYYCVLCGRIQDNGFIFNDCYVQEHEDYEDIYKNTEHKYNTSNLHYFFEEDKLYPHTPTLCNVCFKNKLKYYLKTIEEEEYEQKQKDFWEDIKKLRLEIFNEYSSFDKNNKKIIFQEIYNKIEIFIKDKYNIYPFNNDSSIRKQTLKVYSKLFNKFNKIN